MSLAQPQNDPTPEAPKGWRVLLVKFFRGAIALLESAITFLEQPSTGENTLGKTYSQVLEKVRGVLPAKVNQKLPDWGLSGAIALLAILIFSTTTSLLFSSNKPITIPPRPVAVLPSPEPLVTPEVPINPPSTVSPVLEPLLPEAPVVVTPSTPQPDPQPSPEAILEPIPEVTPVLTPEQTLIASIQEQVTRITPQEEGLITRIKPNFSGSLLKITVSQDWYTLSSDQQDKVAAGLEERSQYLDFRQLLISDITGHLVARKAVVGRGMIILRRVLEAV